MKRLNGIISRFRDGVQEVTRFVARNHDVDGTPFQVEWRSWPVDAAGNPDPDSQVVQKITDLRASVRDKDES